MSILSEKAMLSSLTIKAWSGRKLDRKVTHEVNTAHGAAADAGRYNKALVSRDALAEIVTIGNAARNEHYRFTLPWLQDGSRILPAAAFNNYTAAMRKHSEDFDAAVVKFIAGYGDYVEDARKRLNGMFNAADYPTAHDIAARFAFQRSILPVPSGDDFRVSVADEQAAMIRADIEAKATEALQTAMQDVWARIADNVGHMATKLAEFEPGKPGERASGIFRDSLVENVRDLASLLPSLNITNDPALIRVHDQITSKLCTHDAETLRDNGALREETAAAAAAIASSVADYMA